MKQASIKEILHCSNFKIIYISKYSIEMSVNVLSISLSLERNYPRENFINHSNWYFFHFHSFMLFASPFRKISCLNKGQLRTLSKHISIAHSFSANFRFLNWPPRVRYLTYCARHEYDVKWLLTGHATRAEVNFRTSHIYLK